MAPDVAAGFPVQVLFPKKSNVTFPDGFGCPGWPVTVTKSCTVAPASTTVTVPCAALWICVAVDEASLRIDEDEPAVAVCPAVVQFPFGGGAPTSHTSAQFNVAVSVN